MKADSNLPIVTADDFIRRFSMRGNRLMWLLGAGASAAAGVPTAGDMIWEFKRQVYVSKRHVSPGIVADLANPAVRRELQSFIDDQGYFPEERMAEEYAALFEAVYPSEGDRRTYISAKLNGAKPSYGHIALATLMKSGRARLIWTTNFDPLIADACAKVYDSTGALTTITLDSPRDGLDVLNEENWPVEIKLHGDFRSRRLKNTSDELRQQDASLRQLLIDTCGRFGLIVAGYSGRDDSIMDTLEAALERPIPFPGGLFWLRRREEALFPRVAMFLDKISAKEIDGGIVAIDNFDECLRDLTLLLEGLDTRCLDAFAASRRIVSPAPRPTGNKGFPVIRLNALELTARPSVCRRIECAIGGYSEIAKAIDAAKVEVLATRTRDGVLAFGSDADVRKAFDSYRIKNFDLHPIELQRLRYESQVRGLLRQALSLALARAHGLTLIRRRSADLLYPSSPGDSQWKQLRSLVGTLAGTVTYHPELAWHEGVGIRLDWADDRLWVLFEPRTGFTGMTAENKDDANGFARERTVRRYNRSLNELISFWAQKLSADGAEFRTLGLSTGVDATFRLDVNTAYSRRAH